MITPETHPRVVIVNNPARPFDGLDDLVNVLKYYKFKDVVVMNSISREDGGCDYKKLTVSNTIQANLIIAIGGDGSVLQAKHRCWLGKPVIIGVNSGHIGFLTACSPDNIVSKLPWILDNPRIETRYSVEVSVRTKNGKGQRFLIGYGKALNEVAFKSSTTGMLHLAMLCDGKLMTNYEADGVIVSTATGSTAYNLSSGGPIVSPESKALTITPICPHTISNRSLVYDEEKTLTFFISREGDMADVLIDNMPITKLHESAWVEVKVYPEPTYLAFAQSNTFYSRLREYLGWNRNDIIHPPFEID